LTVLQRLADHSPAKYESTHEQQIKFNTSNHDIIIIIIIVQQGTYRKTKKVNNKKADTTLQNSLSLCIPSEIFNDAKTRLELFYSQKHG